MYLCTYLCGDWHLFHQRTSPRRAHTRRRTRLAGAISDEEATTAPFIANLFTVLHFLNEEAQPEFRSIVRHVFYLTPIFLLPWFPHLTIGCSWSRCSPQTCTRRRSRAASGGASHRCARGLWGSVVQCHDFVQRASGSYLQVIWFFHRRNKPVLDCGLESEISPQRCENMKPLTLNTHFLASVYSILSSDHPIYPRMHAVSDSPRPCGPRARHFSAQSLGGDQG